MIGSLVRVSTIQDYLGLERSNAVPQLTRLARAASQFALGWMSREDGLGWQEFTEIRDGNDTSFMVLRRWPVGSITSISLGNGQTISTQASGNPPGPCNSFVLAPPGSAGQTVNLIGAYFPRGRLNVTFTYMAGYRIVGEAWEVPSAAQPATGAYTIDVIEEWLGDLGVVDTDTGQAMVPVSGTSPGSGQYGVNADGRYFFNAAQANANIGISYSYTPPDIVQAVIELVGERYKAAKRLGQISESFQGQVTASYSQKDMNDTIKTLLRPYRSVVPA